MIVQFSAGSGSAAAVAIVGNVCDAAAGRGALYSESFPTILRPERPLRFLSAAGIAANGEGMIPHE
jgi:hypothetical protein